MAESERVSIDVVKEPLDIARLISFCEDHAAGALVVFAGTVRNHFEGRAVRAIDYHGYAEMGRTILKKIVDEALDRWKLQRVAVWHRIGVLRLGEVSVAIVVSSAHRKDAYEANRYIIEAIKKDLPIWKKDIFADGAERWQRLSE